MTGWIIKTPDDQFDWSSLRPTRSEAIYMRTSDYILTSDVGQKRQWAKLRAEGYRCVKVELREAK